MIILIKSFGPLYIWMLRVPGNKAPGNLTSFSQCLPDLKKRNKIYKNNPISKIYGLFFPGLKPIPCRSPVCWLKYFICRHFFYGNYYLEPFCQVTTDFINQKNPQTLGLKNTETVNLCYEETLCIHVPKKWWNTTNMKLSEYIDNYFEQFWQVSAYFTNLFLLLSLYGQTWFCAKHRQNPET